MPTFEELEQLIRKLNFPEEEVEAFLQEVKMRSSPKLSVEEHKAQVLEIIQTLITEKIKPRCVFLYPEDYELSYIADLSVEWRKNTLYFTARYRDPNSQVKRLVDYTKISRMAKGRFNLSYRRHTGEYVMLYERILLEECVEMLQEDMLLIP